MLKYIIILVAFNNILIVNVFSQENSYDIDNIFKLYGNRDALVAISPDVRIYDSIGNLIDIKYISSINHNIGISRDKFKNIDSIKKIFIYFDNPQKDWLANCMLYYLTDEDAFILHFFKNNILKWQREGKEYDSEHWKKYIISNNK